MYGAVVPRAGGPAASVDNGDGTFTFQFDDGRPPLRAGGPIAQAKHQQLSQQAPVQPSPELIAAAQPGPDLRTAQSFGLGGGAPMPGMAQAGGSPPRSLSDASAQGAANYAPPPPRTGASVPYESIPHPTQGPPEKVDPSGLSFGQGGGGPTIPTMYAPGRAGGWQPATKAEQPGFKASEGLEAARQGAQGLSMDAIERGREARQAETDHMVTRAATRAETVAQHLSEDESRMKFQQQEVSKRMAKLDELGNEIATKKIDPNKYMKDKGLLGEIGLTLAAAAGQFAAGIGGGTNAALNKIQGDIERDIQAQHANFQGEKESYARKSEGVKMLKEEYQSTNQQIAAHRVLALSAVDAQLDAQKAKLGTLFDDAEYAKAKATLQDRIATEKTTFEKEAWTHTALHSRYAPPVAGGTVQARPVDFDHEKFVPQFGGVVGTKEEASKARAAGQLLGEVDALVDANVKLRNDPKAYVPGTDAHAKLASNQAQLALRIKSPEGEQLGVLAGPDMGLITGAIGDGTAITPGQTAAMQNYRANVHRRNGLARQNLGVVPVQVNRYMDPKTGQVKMGMYYTGGPSSPVRAPTTTQRGE